MLRRWPNIKPLLAKRCVFVMLAVNSETRPALCSLNHCVFAYIHDTAIAPHKHYLINRKPVP